MTLFEQVILFYLMGVIGTGIFLESYCDPVECQRSAIFICSFGWPLYWIALVFLYLSGWLEDDGELPKDP